MVDDAKRRTDCGCGSGDCCGGGSRRGWRNYLGVAVTAVILVAAALIVVRGLAGGG